MDRIRQNQSAARRLLLVGASVGIGAIGWFLLGDSTSLTAAEPQQKVMVKIGNETITESQVAKNAAGELLKVERQRQEVMENAARQQARDRLLELEAKKRGITKEALLEAEVNSKSAAVTDAQVDQFYEERKAQIRGTKEQVAPQIKQYLEQQGRAQAFEDLITRLEAAYKVEYMIEPFRMPVAATGPAKGPANAPVQIVEFSDFECPFCSRVGPTLQQIEKTYGDKVQIVFRQFPLPIHRNARKAGEASLCANEQGKFWEMHDLMFGDQKSLGVDGLKEKASRISGIDATAFNTCLDSGKYAATIDKDLEEGAQAGVDSTPAFFVNGRFVLGAAPFENFAEIIDEELKRKGNS
jgi:protein-disulfide isomerase